MQIRHQSVPAKDPDEPVRNTLVFPERPLNLLTPLQLSRLVVEETIAEILDLELAISGGGRRADRVVVITLLETQVDGFLPGSHFRQNLHLAFYSLPHQCRRVPLA